MLSHPLVTDILSHNADRGHPTLERVVFLVDTFLVVGTFLVVVVVVGMMLDIRVVPSSVVVGCTHRGFVERVG